MYRAGIERFNAPALKFGLSILLTLNAKKIGASKVVRRLRSDDDDANVPAGVRGKLKAKLEKFFKPAAAFHRRKGRSFVAVSHLNMALVYVHFYRDAYSAEVELRKALRACAWNEHARVMMDNFIDLGLGDLISEPQLDLRVAEEQARDEWRLRVASEKTSFTNAARILYEKARVDKQERDRRAKEEAEERAFKKAELVREALERKYMFKEDAARIGKDKVSRRSILESGLTQREIAAMRKKREGQQQAIAPRVAEEAPHDACRGQKKETEFTKVYATDARDDTGDVRVIAKSAVRLSIIT